jgi:hypothetical protein
VYVHAYAYVHVHERICPVHVNVRVLVHVHVGQSPPRTPAGSVRPNMALPYTFYRARFFRVGGKAPAPAVLPLTT